MTNLADEYGMDAEIYKRPFPPTVHVDTRTGAPAALHDLLDQLGLQRHTVQEGDQTLTFHTAPLQLDFDEQKRVATRAIPDLLLAGYKINCTPTVFDEPAYQQAVHDVRARKANPAAQPPAPAGAPSRSAPARRTP
ncbi:hypothetical protein LXH09_27875 [Streptomyces sp. CS7]|uniref:hypothetical protein n=1 Tax=Streptomyces sp. CS-7 TaxID=2906769 RepID=UPI0021B18734|nr:hypothetical protein [Streptomyces sp. CS-7]MCT6780465.1 hypothetical protein [Streptomyces sp. CS-7]